MKFASIVLIVVTLIYVTAVEYKLKKAGCETFFNWCSLISSGTDVTYVPCCSGLECRGLYAHSNSGTSWYGICTPNMSNGGVESLAPESMTTARPY